MQGNGWVEFIRTQRLNTKEEAESLAAFIKKRLEKGIDTFEVKINNAGDVLLPDGYISAANAPLDDKFIKSLNDNVIKSKFPGTGYYDLSEEAAVIAKCVQLNKGVDLTAMFVPIGDADDDCKYDKLLECLEGCNTGAFSLIAFGLFIITRLVHISIRRK